MAFVVPGILGALGALLIVISACLWLRDPPKNLCPGPPGPRMSRGAALLHWIMLLPRLVYRPRCAYDLTGHAPDAHGVIICPECGRHVLRKGHMIRSPRAWRPAHLGCIFIAAGLLVYRFPPVAATTLVRITPTNMLLRGEGVLGSGAPLEVREEIRRRALDHQLDDDQVSRFVRLLVNDLKDDNLVGNARDALEKLSIFGVFDQTPLIEALDSDDPQQRGLAVRLLRSMPKGARAPEALLRLSVEELRSDDRGWNAFNAHEYLFYHVEEARPLLIAALSSDDEQQQRHAMELLRYSRTSPDVLDTLLRLSLRDMGSDQRSGNARASFVFLLRHAEVAEVVLADGLDSDDPQQRLLAAVVAGCANRAALIDQATPILILHLADNRIRGDAAVAARALYGFGPAVLPLLEPYRQSSDPQQRQAVEYIVRRMTTTDSPAKLQHELPWARLTYAAKDALSLEPEYMDMPDF